MVYFTGIPTVKKEMYIDILRRLEETVRRKRPEKWRTNSCFHLHDNAPAHRSVFVEDFLAKDNEKTLEHTPHSPWSGSSWFLSASRMRGTAHLWFYTTPLRLRALTKLRKSINSFIISVCLSVCRLVRPPVRKKQLGSHWKDFHQILYLSIFRNAVQKIQVSLKSDKKSGYFTWTLMYIYHRISLISS